MNPFKKIINQLSLIDYLIVVANVIFIGLYFVLSFNNRISHDDFYSMYIVEEFGVIDGVSLIYNQWCTRYVALLISFFIASFLKFKTTLVIYQLFLVLLCSSSIYLFLTGLKNIVNISFTKFKLINYSIFITCAIFYCSFNIGETWFWLSSSCTYLLSCIVLIFSVGTILTNANTFLNYVVLIVCGITIGGSNGTLSLTLLIFLTFFFIFLWAKKSQLSSIKFSSSKVNKCIVLYLVVHLAFIVMYLGNGNQIRSSFFKEISIFTALIDNIKFSGIIFLKIIPKIIPYCLIFSIVTSTILTPISAPNSIKSSLKKICFSILFLGLVIYIFQLPITYKTQDIGAERTLYPLAIITFFVFTFCFYQFGKLFTNKKHIQKVLSITAVILIIGLNSFQLHNQYHISKSYRESFDNRLIQITQQINNKQILLDPLTESGYLHSAEISNDSNHFTHDQLKLGLKIKGQLKLNKTSR